jgi:polysaccharide export outer membrane protein
VLPFVITTVTVPGQAQLAPSSQVASSAAPSPNAPEPTVSHLGAEVAPNFVIGAGDILQISVWQEPEFGETVEVRPDGKISLPLVSDVQVSGLTPVAAQEQLTAKLQDFVKHPRVSVIVAEVHSQVVYVIGQVERPGSYPMVSNVNVQQLIAGAGGVTRHAKKKHVYILHQGNSKKVPVNYSKVLKGKAQRQNVELAAGDTVVVP